MEEFDKRLEALKEKLELVKRGREELNELRQAIEELQLRQTTLSMQFSEIFKERNFIPELQQKVERLEKIFREFLSIFEKYMEATTITR